MENEFKKPNTFTSQSGPTTHLGQVSPVSQPGYQLGTAQSRSPSVQGQPASHLGRPHARQYDHRAKKNRISRCERTKDSNQELKIIQDADTYIEILQQKYSHDPYRGLHRVRTGHGREALPACPIPGHSDTIATARIKCESCNKEQRFPTLNNWSLGFNEETAVPPKPPPYPGPLELIQHCRWREEENFWKSQIMNFQQTRQNQMEKEAQRDVFDLQDNKLREHHIAHLTYGGFTYDPHLQLQFQQQINLLEQDTQQSIATITALTVEEDPYATYENILEDLRTRFKMDIDVDTPVDSQPVNYHVYHQPDELEQMEKRRKNFIF